MLKMTSNLGIPGCGLLEKTRSHEFSPVVLESAKHFGTTSIAYEGWNPSLRRPFRPSMEL